MTRSSEKKAGKERSAPRLITFEVDVTYTKGHVPTELPPVTITGGEPIHLSLPVTVTGPRTS